jgi:F-type H+-transporting ATPase subunit gamma
MANTREIQNRIKGIRDTMKITSAMYMISSTKLRRAQKEVEETEPFFYSLQSMVARIVRHVPDMEHRYFRPENQKEIKSRGYLVVTADKGMAGAYNHNVLKLAEEELGKVERHSLLVVGEVGRAYFHTRKIPVDEEFLYTAQNPTMHRARIIAGKVLELYESGKAEEIYMIFTDIGKGGSVQTRMERLLPLEKGDFSGVKAPLDVYQEEFFFEPSPEVVMDYIIPNYLSGYIYGALMESYCSEHHARMLAMQGANDSARTMIQELSVEYNRVRQAEITREITEVVSGARAQKKKKARRSHG